MAYANGNPIKYMPGGVFEPPNPKPQNWAFMKGVLRAHLLRAIRFMVLDAFFIGCVYVLIGAAVADAFRISIQSLWFVLLFSPVFVSIIAAWLILRKIREFIAEFLEGE